MSTMLMPPVLRTWLTFMCHTSHILVMDEDRGPLGVSLFGGLEWTTGTLEWWDYWNGPLDYWNGLLEHWNAGTTGIPCNRPFSV